MGIILAALLVLLGLGIYGLSFLFILEIAKQVEEDEKRYREEIEDYLKKRNEK